MLASAEDNPYPGLGDVEPHTLDVAGWIGWGIKIKLEYETFTLFDLDDFKVVVVDV